MSIDEMTSSAREPQNFHIPINLYIYTFDNIENDAALTWWKAF